MIMTICDFFFGAICIIGAVCIGLPATVAIAYISTSAASHAMAASDRWFERHWS